jgi:hypothetical protein
MYQPLTTTERIICVKGKVMYNDRRRRIDIKRPVRDLFESNQEVYYVMELCLSEARLQQRIKELSTGKVMPVILYFTGGEK